MADSEINTFIYGKNPVLEALEKHPERIQKIYVRKTLKNRQIQQIHDLSSTNRIPVSHVPGSKLFEFLGKVNDQGVAAQISPVAYTDFEPWLDGLKIDNKTAVLLLDELEDPHNVGAILRTAAAAGISAVLLPKHRQTHVTPAVMKTSAGTAGRIPIVRAGNLNQTILRLKDAGFWVAGLDQQGENSLWQLESDRPWAFIIGSEGTGIRKKTLEHCDVTFSIAMKNRVESLNASVSAALIAYEWLRKTEIAD